MTYSNDKILTMSLTNDQAVQQFQIYKRDLNKLAAKISELDAEKDEHQLIQTLIQL